jgi:hypothetical protein
MKKAQSFSRRAALDAAVRAARLAADEKELSAARARGAKASLKAARKAFKQAKKAARKAAKKARQARKTLKALAKNGRLATAPKSPKALVGKSPLDFV